MKTDHREQVIAAIAERLEELRGIMREHSATWTPNAQARYHEACEEYRWQIEHRRRWRLNIQ